MTRHRLSKLFTILFLMGSPLFSGESSLYPFFSPPKSWNVAKPDSLAPKVRIGFFGKAKGPFTPSINLAEEATRVDLESYLKAVQTLYESDKDKRWRNLGSFPTKAGPAVLTSIDFSLDDQAIRVLQLILLKNNIAYLLTAASSKNEYGTHQKTFLDSFSSFELLADLSDPIKDVKKRSDLEEKTKHLLSSPETKRWEAFQAFVLKEFTKEGVCWQILFLDSLKEKIQKNPS